MRQKLITAILVLLGFACSTDPDSSTQVINLDDLPEREIKLSDLITDPVVIPLETIDESILSGYNRKLVGSKYIVTVDQNQILLFGRDGSFIRKVAGTGNGPGEFSQIADFDFDSEGDLLYIAQYGKKELLAFDLEGEKYSSIKIPEASYTIKPLPNNQILAVGSTGSEYRYFIVDSSTEEILYEEKKEPNSNFMMSIGTYLGNTTNGEIFFKSGTNDTLYQFVEGRMKKHIFFEFDDKLEKDKTSKGKDLSISKITDKYMLLTKTEADLEMSPNMARMSSSGGQSIVYNRESGELYGLEEPFNFGSYFINNEESGFILETFHLTDDFETEDPVQQALYELVKSKVPDYSVEDNPVIVLGKFPNKL